MRRWGLVAALLFLVLTNAFLFARLAYNRAGEPEATVVLTGREVSFEAGWRGPEGKKGRPISVSLNWNAGYTPWFDRAKLEALGFDLRLPPHTAERANTYYLRLLPRQAYAVLEYEGQGYEAWRRETAEKIKNMEAREREGKLDKWGKETLEGLKIALSPLSSQSRLFAVDVGLDPDALRRQYPDRRRFLISPVQMKVNYSSTLDETTKKWSHKITGYIHYLLVSSIYVSARQRDQLEEIIPRLKPAPGDKPAVPLRSSDPRPEVTPEKRRLVSFTICYGQSYEPWVADIRLEEEAK